MRELVNLNTTLSLEKNIVTHDRQRAMNGKDDP